LGKKYMRILCAFQKLL